jgi:hypothetical protein
LYTAASALPEPRCFAATTIDPLSRLAAQAAHAADATQRRRSLSQLRGQLGDALPSGRDDLLWHALANVISPAAGLALVEALDHVINTPTDPEGGLAARLFAIPVVFVAAGLAGAEVAASIAVA